MSERKREELEDDGRTIADMSGVTRRNLFGFDPNALRSAAGVEKNRQSGPVSPADPRRATVSPAKSGSGRSWEP